MNNLLLLPLPTQPQPEPQIPPALDTERFRDVWARWVKHRRHLKKPHSWSDLFQNQLDTLARYGEQTAYETVEFSVFNGYQGLFPDRFKRNYTVTHTLSGIDKTILYDELKRLQKRIENLRVDVRYHPSVKQELSLCRLRADEIRGKLGISGI